MGSILIVGARGQLGCEIRALAAGNGGFRYADVAPDEGTCALDITDRAAVMDMVAGGGFDAIVNCAAYTAVDRAEEQPEAAFAVNADGAANLAAAAAATGAALVHISTDYVFDGRARVPYREGDPTGPLGVYGRSKLDGERRVAESGCRGIIIRTSWLYSAYGANFVKTILRLGAERDTISVVDDRYGSPTWAADLARAVTDILPQLARTPRRGDVYHYCNAGAATWFDFARAIVRSAGLGCAVKPIGGALYPAAAPRPAWSVLDASKITADLGVAVPRWEASLERCMEQIMCR